MLTEQKTTLYSDATIQQQVLAELRWDTRVKETDVGVEVDNGVVTLTGTVDSYAAKQAALEAAHHVAGVLDVANDLQVKIPGTAPRTDTEIAQAVRWALEWDVTVPHQRIQTTVTDGWVTLEGRVPRLVDRQEAERAIRNLSGVQGVVNNILVVVPQINEEEVHKAIEDALERQAEREANRIQVEIKNGTLTLTGQVRSWREKEAVLGAAGHAPGVRAVQDHLKVAPYS